MEVNIKKTKTKYNFFADCVIKKYISKKDYLKYKQTKQKNEKLDDELTKKIAGAMKNWAIKNGATHYTHWFQPLTGKTAGKQVSFFEFQNEKLISFFDAKTLMSGETDASSFPNGGERMTFEARGYTVWDYTSYAVLQEYENGKKVLLIPTAFFSYNSVALDEKTPLLRALENINQKSVALLKKLGYENVSHVTVNTGSEQEYFLIEKELFEKRCDLVLTGRTLLGQKPIKNQEQHKNYFQSIPPKVHAFMEELNSTLLTMGIDIKLQHNEVAPCQYEIVPVYTNCNQSCDQNQLIMENLKNIAQKHGFVALLNEKPFEYINGSGKHLNWSISTNTGINLLDGNNTDKDLFLTFLTLVISAIDEYNALVRLTASHYGNDFRLGGFEAPPTIISIYLGEELTLLLENLGQAKNQEIKRVIDMGVKCLPKNTADSSDRNRTSPFAFTGNKFEFRMIGSSQTISFASTVLITALSQKIEEFTNKLEDENLYVLLKKEIQKHKRIIFNENGYCAKWLAEAKERNLPYFDNCLDCVEILDDKKVIDMFENQKVMNKKEIQLRKEVLYKNYSDTAMCEAICLKNMLSSQVMPALWNQITLLQSDKSMQNDYCINTKNTLTNALNQVYASFLELSENILTAQKIEGGKEKAYFIYNNILKNMREIRNTYDAVEDSIFVELKPIPTYNEILYGAKI